ncbi:MAG: radical SAM family heme chaperone HemW [Bacteroidetes bacterium]|nr:radical SAM family heme chaperone HemW [Bacteroidota bacterium]
MLAQPCGLYVHIPFCRKACHYCDFHFSTSTALRNEMLAAILQEIGTRAQPEHPHADTIYLGGGTPSILPASDLMQILNALHAAYQLSPNAEITLEANPDDIDAQRLSEWRSIGINRLSIGIQSFREEDLRWMNRSHSAAQARTAVDQALSQQFTDLSIDLIYGLPDLSTAAWEENLDIALSLGVPHLSCYALTVEKGTPLEALIQREKKPAPIPEQQAEQYLLLLDRSAAAGYEAYEISNFSLPGHRSRHNSAYWNRIPYAGFGPSAHSYDGHTRQWNLSSNTGYIQAIREGTPAYRAETLTPEQQLNEYVMTALRTLEGIDLQKVAQQWGDEQVERLIRSVSRFVPQGQVELSEAQIRLTREGRLFADGITLVCFL